MRAAPHSLALGFLAIASPILVLLFFLGPPGGDVLFALLAAAFPLALIILGATRQGRLGRLFWPLLGLLVLLGVFVGAMLLLRGTILSAPWFGGLPLATAFQVYGLFLTPLLIVSLAYALTFEEHGLRQEDLEALRKRLGKPGEP